MTNSIEQVIQSIKSEIQVNEDGKAWLSLRAVARLAGIEQSSLSRAFSTDAQKPSKLSKTLLEQGFDGDAQTEFLVSGIPDVVLPIILEYYAFSAGIYCTEIARLCFRAFSTIGVRLWLQDLNGWQNPESLKSECLTIADASITALLDIKAKSPVIYQYALNALDLKTETVNESLAIADTTSLVANRLSLAFNKHLKAFESIRSATSPEAFDSLKDAYSKLCEEFSELLATKTPQPKIEYVERIVYAPSTEYESSVAEKLEIMGLKMELAKAKQEIERLKAPKTTGLMRLNTEIF
jgi:hypothetical protein